MSPIDAALNEAGLDKDEIEEVLLVGGTTRIPKIVDMIEQKFNGKKPNH